jgi:hypothetical protein
MVAWRHCWAVGRQQLPLHWRQREPGECEAYVDEPTAHLCLGWSTPSRQADEDTK